MSILRKPFGGGADLFVITNQSGASVSITNYGGIVTRIDVPDRDGKIANVALGCDSYEDYRPNNGYLGALIGRCGNRINRGRFTLNGAAYQLATNSNGHHLHGGTVGFDQKMWEAEFEPDSNELKLRYVSPDGEEHYPGTLSVCVTYAFTEENALSIHYKASTDRDTLCNLTNHSYFNLDGEEAGTKILDHIMQIDSDFLTVVDADSIPTGEQRAVDGTPFDLRTGKRIGDEIDSEYEQMRFGKGFDHNFMLRGAGLRRAARLSSPRSGRVMEVYTDQPAVQFYAGNMLDGTMMGHRGTVYTARDGLCLETQVPPDAINHPDFSSCVLRPSETYDTTTIYRFSVE